MIWIHQVIYVLWAKQRTVIQLVILDKNQQLPWNWYKVGLKQAKKVIIFSAGQEIL